MGTKEPGWETVSSSSLDAAQSGLETVSSADYFESYGDLEVHHLMLKDTVRIESYKKAIQSCAQLFKDKVVMDVGAGTGIISVLCAQAGAATVYAVEASHLATFISNVATENNFSEVIKVLKQKVEEVVLPCKVDIIVSEWMGFYLLHEGMLDSVLAARDLHLKPGGKIFPEIASIWCAPCSLPQLYDFWEDVAGCRMKSIGAEWRKLKSQQPQIVEVSSEDLLCDAGRLCRLDLNKTTMKELDCISECFVQGSNREGKYQGLCVWFTCEFPTADDASEVTILSTAPGEPLTHWKQTAIMLADGVEVEEGAPIAWQLKLERLGGDTRHYNVEFTELDAENESHPVPCKCYRTKCIVIRTFLEQSEKEEDSKLDTERYEDDEYAEKYSDPDSDEGEG